MLEEADRDGDGMLNFEEFYRIMRRRGDPLDDFDSDDEWVGKFAFWSWIPLIFRNFIQVMFITKK